MMQRNITLKHGLLLKAQTDRIVLSLPDMAESASTLSDAGSVVLPNMDYILPCTKLIKKKFQM